MSGKDERASRLLAYLLRHAPHEFDVQLTSAGWAEVEAVLRGLASRGHALDRDQLARLVGAGDKQRFELDRARGRIRALHGHSLPVELALPVVEPPPALYHGTVGRFLPSIRSQGLLPQGRRHVHLSETRAQALEVGARRGEPVLLVVDSARMARDGHEFGRSESAVWLVARVPPDYLCEDG